MIIDRLTKNVKMNNKNVRRRALYPMGMIIPSRANCNCLGDKQTHNMKTGKLDRDEYIINFERFMLRVKFAWRDLPGW